MSRDSGRRKDLSVEPLTALNWEPGEWSASASLLYQHVEADIRRTIDWYLTERRMQAFWSRSLRLAAILCVIAGGIIPLVHAARATLVAPEWGYVALAGAAGCALLDRFFGFSSSWMRYMRTQFALQRMLTEFQFEWTGAVAIRDSSTISQREQEDALTLIRDAAVRARTLVEAETEAWINELSFELDSFSRTIGDGLPRRRSNDG